MGSAPLYFVSLLATIDLMSNLPCPFRNLCKTLFQPPAANIADQAGELQMEQDNEHAALQRQRSDSASSADNNEVN